ncbi:uncharacterized protein LOC143459788 isoform X2 [Clavelina lepadiformis]|uniref:uncharacterized protein LOC143459788 isoform X2 n=1 Tax=Clavelina lepadiformis TaxID=159417 RepID=UPI0040438D6A
MFKNKGSMIQVLLITWICKLVKAKDTCMPNYKKPCGTGITEEICHQRNCCFRPSFIRRHNCFQKTVQDTLDASLQYLGPVERNPGEIAPPDDIQLSTELNREVETLTYTGVKQITPSQALRVAFWLENFLRHKAEEGKDVNWQFSKENVFHAAIKVRRETFLDEVEFESGSTIQVDPVNQNLMENISALIFVEYLTMGRILQNQSSETTKQINRNISCPAEAHLIDNATVISVTAYDKHWEEMSIALTFSVKGVNQSELMTTNPENRLSCEYFNENSHQWSSSGCVVLGTMEESITCSCNHTTKFSVLFVVHPLPFVVQPEHSANVKVLEFVMEGLSFVCLVVTFLSLILVLRRRSKPSTSAGVRARERIVVHINFAASLSALHLTRLTSDAAYDYEATCAITVVLTHYFMLSSGMWMLIEGIVLYVNVIVKSMKLTKLGWYKFVAGWATPAIIVIIAAAIGFSNKTYVQRTKQKFQCPYSEDEAETLSNKYEYCWVSVDSNMIWSVTGPLLAIFVINFFILTHTVAFVLQLSLKSDSMKPSGQKSQHGQHIWNTTKGILVLFPILGVPWLIGFLINITDYRANIAFRYIHVTLNGLQGVFIFILYCGVNKEVREIVGRVANNKWQQHKLSLSRSANNSSTTPREKFKKSITSLLGYNSPAVNKRPGGPQRVGSQISQQSYQTQQRPSSASGSVNSTILRHKRKYSSTSTEQFQVGTNRRVGYTGGLGYTGSLPRGWSCRAPPQVTRTPSTRSLRSDTSRNNSIPRICTACGALRKGCRHETIPGTSNDPNEPTLTYMEFHDSIVNELPTFNPRWHRMTAEEFKRFSSIPEEKRRSGINSFILDSGDGASNIAHAWDKKAKTLGRTNISESYGNTFNVSVDIHFSGTESQSEDDAESSDSDEGDVGFEEEAGDKNSHKSIENDEEEVMLDTKPVYNELKSSDKNIVKKSREDIFREKIGSSKSTSKSSKPIDSKCRLSMPTPPKAKRKSNRMSGYSEQLLKAIEKWKTEAALIAQEKDTT